MTVQTHPRHRRHRRHHAVTTHQTVHPATQSYTQGVDVSRHNGHVDWTKVRSSGVAWAVAKATEGKSHIDPTFSANWAGMKAAGLVRGAYHFGHPGHDAVAQAKRFVKVVKPTHGDLPLVLDLEASDKETPAEVWAWTKAFLAEIESLTGRPGILYTYTPFWTAQVGDPKEKVNCPLWVAAYIPQPNVARAWADWTFWQYTSKGTVDGVHTHVDRSYFLGTLAELKQLTLP